MLIKIKERYFKSGIKKRIALYNSILDIKGIAPAGNIDIVLTRGLPKNLVELSSVVTNLQEIVPNEQLLQLLPFVTNVQDTLDMLAEENKNKISDKKDTFCVVNNTPPDGGEKDAE